MPPPANPTVRLLNWGGSVCVWTSFVSDVSFFLERAFFFGAVTLLSIITSEVPLAAKNDSKLSRGRFQSPTGSGFQLFPKSIV